MPRTAYLIVRISQQESKMLSYLSKKIGLPVSDVVRQLVLRAYRQEKKRK